MKSTEESILTNKKKNSKNVDIHLKTRNEKLIEKGYVPNITTAPNSKVKPKKKSWFRKSKKTEEEKEIKLPAQIGVSLDELYNRTRSIPEIIIECIYNAKNNLETEGLFRVPGDTQKMKDIEKQLQLGTFTKLDESVGQHTSASLLKHFFRELPDPLFTFANNHAFTDTIKLSNEEFSKENIKLINTLSFAHRLVIITILPFLKEISSFSSKNLMNEGNLGIVFGPTLMKSPEEVNGQVDMTNKRASFIESLIINADKILPHINTQDPNNLNNSNNKNNSPVLQHLPPFSHSSFNPPLKRSSGDRVNPPLKRSSGRGTEPNPPMKKTPPPINSLPPPSIDYNQSLNNTIPQPINNNVPQEQPNNSQVSYINAVVLYNYQGDIQKGQIDLLQNAQVLIHSKYSGGWGYGFSNGKGGYFPLSYVREF
eukprot:TRINITY_DN2579_c3_g2_i2.p1 TRINITY_DN2579_c3_g2~~TRINITY_DN2579_c3_g2_i2.p1  ORF type:complete len:425 (-),score=119.83 TRINITY_DN2579_c3_g2_i2:173-1447(-)